MPRRQRLWLIILLVLAGVLVPPGLAPTPVCLAADVAAVQDEGGPAVDQDAMGLDGRLRIAAVRPVALAALDFIPTVTYRALNSQARSSILTHSPPAHS